MEEEFSGELPVVPDSLLHGGLLLLDGYIAKNEMEQWVGHARNSEKNICYLVDGLREEDRFYAAGQIVESAKNLQEVMEKLLIMGNVRDGSIRMERVSLGALLKTLEEKYPGIETDCQIESVEGDKTLLLCMLENLTANGLSAGRHVKVTANAQGIRIWNDGETMDEKDVKAVNKGQEITGSRVGRHGYGIQVCREIARAHGWRLVYRSSSEEGTTASAVF